MVQEKTFCEECKEDHINTKEEWLRHDTGEKTFVGPYGQGPGAMWFEEMLDDHGNGEVYKGNGQWNNDDGLHLMVMVPYKRTKMDGTLHEGAHQWDVDSRCSNCTLPEDRMHRCWVRHGEVPNITVDKNGPTCSAGQGSILTQGWHGFLRNGYLVEC